MTERGWQHCKRCDYRWYSRVVNPQQCPKCKRYDFNKDIAQTKNENTDTGTTTNSEQPQL